MTMGKKLFVGNLAFSTTGSDLEALFASAGTVESATVVSDRESGRSRGFGFVEMSSSSEASKAMQELNGRDVGGRQINVSEAKERESRSGGGGGGGGGGGRPGGGGGFGRRSY
jgi:RNA recognition motif-containing protein